MVLEHGDWSRVSEGKMRSEMLGARGGQPRMSLA